jgi:hypothetical protein
MLIGNNGSPTHRNAGYKRVMRKAWLIAVLTGAFCSNVMAVDPVYRPLWQYEGSWKATPAEARGKPAATEITNDCAMVGRFFACQQTIDGKPGPMIVFLPAEKAGDYYTQSVSGEGLAGGRGDLHIEGDHWTYLGKSEKDGKVTYYRTTNVFTGPDKIHYEQAESPDGKNWTVTGGGDEVRTAKGKMSH